MAVKITLPVPEVMTVCGIQTENKANKSVEDSNTVLSYATACDSDKKMCSHKEVADQ